MTTALGTVVANGGRVLRLWFEVVPAYSNTSIAPDSDTPVMEDDKQITRYTTSVTGEQVSLPVTVSYALCDGPVSFSYTSDNPTKISIDSAGILASQAAPEETASATISIVATQGECEVVREVFVTLTVSGASVIDVIDGGVSGSARKALSDVLDNAISGANPITDLGIFSTQDHATPVYVRNSNFYLSSHEQALTCASPWNSSGGKRKAGTAITKRHAVLATHFKYGIGTVVRFIAANGDVVDKTVVQAGEIVANSDGWMVLFDSDLPPSITPCKIFPSDYKDYLPAGANTAAAAQIPVLVPDQEEKGVIWDLAHFSTSVHGTDVAQLGFPVLPDRLALNEPRVTGDSGNPWFAAIGSELWLLAAGGPFYGGSVDETNAAILALDTLQGDLTGYTVTEGDLSSYPTYP